MIEVVAGIIRRQDRILITRRPDNVHLAGFWEFPGGKVEAGESFEQALCREIREELGIEIRVESDFLHVDYDYPGKPVRLYFFNCVILDGEPRALGVADLKWVSTTELRNYRFPPADERLIDKLASESSR